MSNLNDTITNLINSEENKINKLTCENFCINNKNLLSEFARLIKLLGGNAVISEEAESLPSADFVISDAATFTTFRNNILAGNTYEGKTVSLTTNLIDLGSGVPDGIGSFTDATKQFKGTFEGNGRTIKYFYAITTGHGFFNATSGATIKNLNIENVCVMGGSSSPTEDMGCLIGKAIQTKIDNCHIKNAFINGTKNIGGLVGSASGIVITNSSFNGFINICKGYQSIGGLIGYNYAPSAGSFRITNNSINGAIMSNDVDTEIINKKFIIIGGIVGYHTGDSTTSTTNNSVSNNFINCNIIVNNQKWQDSPSIGGFGFSDVHGGWGIFANHWTKLTSELPQWQKIYFDLENQTRADITIGYGTPGKVDNIALSKYQLVKL